MRMQEEDYVTEKFAQALEAGSVPIVIGPLNIGDYEPAPGSVLVLNSIEDVPKVAAQVQYLLENRCHTLTPLLAVSHRADLSVPVRVL